MKINSSKPVSALVVTAAGSSSRMGTGKKKEFLPFGDGTVLSSACVPFFLSDFIPSFLVITYAEGLLEETKAALYKSEQLSALLSKYNVNVIFSCGGSSRQLSVYNGLKALDENGFSCMTSCCPLVFIHDGARPFISESVINDAGKTAAEHGAAVPGIRVPDTLARLDENGFLSCYVDRTNVIQLQTPQVFDFKRLFDAHKKAVSEGKTEFTDDTSIWNEFAGKTAVSKGSRKNCKITYKEDLLYL